MNVLRASIFLLVTVGLLVAFVVLVLVGGGVEGPQNTFSPAGEVAEKQRDLFLLALWPAIVILILVTGALGYALIRFRRKEEDEAPPKQVHGNTRLEVAWTIAPTLLLLGLAVPVIVTIVDLGEAPGEDAMPVTVIGQQFSWRFEYPEITDANGNLLGVPDELRIPVGRQIAASLESQDVIHSFWMPKLAGKQDVVPGSSNPLTFSADEPGIYPGQCAEFCGLLHAEMRFTVIALPEEEFQAWVDEQLAAQSARAGGSGTN